MSEGVFEALDFLDIPGNGTNSCLGCCIGLLGLVLRVSKTRDAARRGGFRRPAHRRGTWTHAHRICHTPVKTSERMEKARRWLNRLVKERNKEQDGTKERIGTQTQPAHILYSPYQDHINLDPTSSTLENGT